MRDKNDNLTFDPFLVKRRGRPPSKNPKTAAQYKSENRRRDFENLLTGNVPISDIPITSLCDFLSRAVTAGGVDRVNQITSELLARALKNKA